MADHVKDRKERKQPGLSFLLPLDIIFSIATTYDLKERFKYLVSQNNQDISKILREFVFKRLKVNNRKEFEDIFFNEMKAIKLKIYEKMGVSRNKSFSEMMLDDIEKYNKENEI